MFLRNVNCVIKRLLISSLVLLISCGTFASPPKRSQRPSVNILTWWGYLDSSKKQIHQIENTCRVRISHDDYYSNAEFLQRFKGFKSNYDIIIFSETILGSVEKSIARPKSKLYLLANSYYPVMKKHYLKNHFPHNIVYFEHALTGFLYNPGVIKIRPEDSIYEVFRNAKNNIVIMIDDPVEANFLISLLESKNERFSMKKADKTALSWSNFKKIIQHSHVVITNSLEHISQLPSFAFAFQWSGDAIELLKKSDGRLKFLVHPTLSYVSTDLLADLNERRATRCVARALGGEKFLTGLQNRTYYFSPYMNGKTIKDAYFKKIFDDTLKQLPSLPWITTVSMRNFKSIESSWSRIKYNLAAQYE
jgi:hypothetical protein